MDARKSSELQLQKPEQRMFSAVIEQAYLDLFGSPQRAEDRYNSRNAATWLFGDFHQTEREEIFDLAGVGQEAMNRELLKIISDLIKRNTV